MNTIDPYIKISSGIYRMKLESTFKPEVSSIMTKNLLLNGLLLYLLVHFIKTRLNIPRIRLSSKLNLTFTFCRHERLA